ncbi:alpha-amylase 2-like [Amphiura filiformis]|uniref:alpha-amylase 2-like n=1 Tax=Amphiura filiformis TaxID=82378 RepID=UPI003B215C27
MAQLLLVFALLGAVSAQWDPNTAYNRQAMVHLFEWKWSDIANECESYLGPYGFGGVQVSPPNEHAVIWIPFRPWWERYQPVSYELTSRSGNDGDFRDMVTRCNNVGVRIYVDAVINHMARESGTGSAGHSFSNYNFPSSWNFNVPNGKCSTSSGKIENYQDANQVRNCNLLHLNDIDLSNSFSQRKVVNFMNYMIGIGVAGFRVDAVKHMWPGDLQLIYGSLNNLNTQWFLSGSRPFIVQEVIDQGGEPIKATDYDHLGRVTEFKYGLELGNAFHGNNQLKWLKNFGEAWSFLSDGAALAFIDNHDNQRGHGGGGGIVTHADPRMYKMANAYMLAWPYGFTRVMSSYYFRNGDSGPPSDCKGNTKSPTFDSNGACELSSGWVCEHRWRQIRNMVGFRNAAAGQNVVNWWDNGNNQIAFGRGNKAFIAINGDTYTMTQALQTGLPSGTYCNVILADYQNGKCVGDGGSNGPTITVDGSGFATFSVGTGDDPVAAIHINAKM